MIFHFLSLKDLEFLQKKGYVKAPAHKSEDYYDAFITESTRNKRNLNKCSCAVLRIWEKYAGQSIDVPDKLLAPIKENFFQAKIFINCPYNNSSINFFYFDTKEFWFKGKFKNIRFIL